MEKIELTIGYHGCANITVHTMIVTPHENADNTISTEFLWDYWTEDVDEALDVVRLLNSFLKTAHNNGLFFYKEKPIPITVSTKQSFKDDPLTEGEMNHIFENMKEVESS